MNAMAALGEFQLGAAEVDAGAFQALMRLESEIARVLHSQAIMWKANRALRRGRSDDLFAMDFTPEHVADLERRVQAGGNAFPDYVLRNNADLIRLLRARQTALVNALFAPASAVVSPCRRTEFGIAAASAASSRRCCAVCAL